MDTKGKHTPGPLELADELMAMAETIAAATSENGASIVREAAYQLRVGHAASDLLIALKGLLVLFEEIDGGDHDQTDEFVAARAAIAKAEAR